MASLQQLRNTHPSFKLTGQAYPASTVADMAIAATGASMERSGIVGDAWINENGTLLFPLCEFASSEVLTCRALTLVCFAYAVFWRGQANAFRHFLREPRLQLWDPLPMWWPKPLEASH